MIKIKRIWFTEILPIWQNELWPNRKSKIETHSAMQIDKTIDMNIFNYSSTFLGAFHNDVLVGVNSGHKTSDSTYRSRGLYVRPEFRGKEFKISSMLLSETCDAARQEGCKLVWTIPRKDSLKAYEREGFFRTSDFFDEGMEFGPNCYAVKYL